MSDESEDNDAEWVFVKEDSVVETLDSWVVRACREDGAGGGWVGEVAFVGERRTLYAEDISSPIFAISACKEESAKAIDFFSWFKRSRSFCGLCIRSF